MSTKNDASKLRLLHRLVIHIINPSGGAERREKLKWRVCYGLSKSDHLTDAEVSGYRFQPQRQRHVFGTTLEASGMSDHEKKDTREAERTKTKLAETVAVPNQFVDAVTSLSA